MSEREERNDPEPNVGHQPGEESQGGEPASQQSGRQARDELFEAIDHFRNAANLFFDRAANDPAVKSATDEAERFFQRIGETAEPLARQLTGELGKLTKRITETYHHTVEGRRRRPTDDEGSPQD